MLILDRDFLADLRYWTETQPRIAVKILSLVEEISRDPFRGTRKPAPLKTSNAWSRSLRKSIGWYIDPIRIKFFFSNDPYLCDL